MVKDIANTGSACSGNCSIGYVFAGTCRAEICWSIRCTPVGGVFCGVRLPDSHESRRLVACVVVAISLLIIVKIAAPTAQVMYDSGRDLLRGRLASAHVHWQVADGLSRMGIQPGDQVALIGLGGRAYWARLARVRIVAEVPQAEESEFQEADKFWGRTISLSPKSSKPSREPAQKSSWQECQSMPL